MNWMNPNVRTRKAQVMARRTKQSVRPRRRGVARRSNALALSYAVIISILIPAVAVPAGTTSATVGQGFTVTPADLAFILQQIKIAEFHVANTTSETGPCGALIGPGPDQIPSPLISLGLRTVDGSCNNLIPGQETFGAADRPFPRLTTPVFRDAEAVPPGFGQPGSTSYTQTSGNVFDSQPRVISNLIVDQTSSNPAAVAAAGFPIRSQGNSGVVPCTTEPTTPGGHDGVPAGCVPAHETLDIPNVTTDVGLSPPFNSLFTIFGQFFDHGLDKITNGGNGTVFVPLQDDDPLIAGPNHIFGDSDDLRANQRFMVLTRGTIVPGPDGNRSAPNTDSPFVDQSQTYTSHPSHQVFTREYVDNTDGKPVSTGLFLSTADGGLPTWAMVKDQARNVLGLELVDADVTNIPMIAADPYGKFIPGPNGLPQYVTAGGVLVEGNRSNPVAAPADVRRIDTAFLNDIAHAADPGSLVSPKNPDPDTVAGGSLDSVPAGQYDNELLDLHVICGDGRCNENIALQSIHQVFHSEHDRLIGDIMNTLVNDTSGVTNLADWQTPLGADGWNGERLFQAARFVTEMEYQHLVFEEFARKVQPAINPFEAFAFNQTNIDPAITAEFAHAVYRFGHSMLTDSIPRINADGSRNDIGLLEGFLNPAEYYDGGSAGLLSSRDAAGSIIMGLSDEVGQELDEFVVNTLRNNLLGLPLDLAAINLTRARSEGVASLNNVRREIFNATNDGQLTPYTDWVDFGQNLKHPESLVNFIAAYGTHSTVGSQSTLSGRRTAADQIVNGTVLPGPDGIVGPDPRSLDDTPAFPAGPGPDGLAGTDCESATPSPECADNTPAVPAGPGPDEILGVVPDTAVDDVQPPQDAADFMFSTGAWANAGTTSITGVDGIDLWVGGLAERTNLFGGLLGSTFNYVFESQLTDLQDGDRFYYLARTPGMNLRAQLEGNSFSELVMRNTNAHTLKADPFATADCKFELGRITWPATSLGSSGLLITGPGSVQDDPLSECDENEHLLRMPNGTFRYRATNTAMPSGINAQAVYNGSPGVVADRIYGGADNDTFWGGEGNDIIEGGDGADVALGGEGNDIITDLAGDDVPKGGPGNDALDGGPGLDILMGGDGHDVMNGGQNDNEGFGGQGDDFYIGGAGIDAMFGDSGDDWGEGGGGPDLLIGDSSSLFLNDYNLPGHDVLIGQGGDDDYDLEGGDDIGVSGPGVEKIAGAAGYDWEIGVGDPVTACPSGPEFVAPCGQDMDLAQVFVVGGVLLPGVRDKFNEVEALSGWNFNDVLRGDSVVPADVGGGGFLGCDVLDAAGVARIVGLDALVPASSLTRDSAPIIANSFTNHCLVTGNVWGDGNILLGGAGSDLLEGRGANDILDGDRYLNVRLSVRTNRADPISEIGSTNLMGSNALTGNFGPGTTGMNLRQAVFAGLVDPGNIVIVRELLKPSNGSAVDTALFSGIFNEYTITFNNDTSVTVAHTAPAGVDDGIDTLWNVEQARFADQTVLLTGNRPNTSTVTIGNLPATENATLTSTVVLADADGVTGVTPTLAWQAETAPNVWVTVGSGSTFTPGNPQVGLRLRLAISFVDQGGYSEQAFSALTALVINVNDPPVGSLTMNPAFPQRTELVTSTSTITDADGLIDVAFQYQWQNRIGATAAFTNIAGATGPTFTPTQTEVGRFLRLVVSYTDNHGTAEQVASATNVVGDVRVGTAGNDLINGTLGRDSLSGLAGLDTLNGSDADDLIMGGADNDAVNGQNGNDVIVFDGVAEGFDAVNGGANTLPGVDEIRAMSNGTIIGLRSIAAVELVTANGFGGVTIAGSPAADTLNFTAVTLTNIDSIDGGGGSDTITGSVGADAIFGGAGIDNLNGGNGDDFVVGGVDDDTVNGGAGNDAFPVGVGDGFDIVTGGVGIDTIAAMADNVVIGLRSIASTEVVTANTFTGVTIAGNGVANTLNFGAVTMTGIGSIDGGGGNDTITGTAAADTILGGAGADTINGGGGDDTITGGDGNDIMNGQAGFDRFGFAAGFGADVINGFDANPGGGGQDVLDVSALGITAASFAANVTIAAGPAAGSTLVTIAGVGTIQVNGVAFPGTAANQITIQDFILAP